LGFGWDQREGKLSCLAGRPPFARTFAVFRIHGSRPCCGMGRCRSSLALLTLVACLLAPGLAVADEGYTPPVGVPDLSALLWMGIGVGSVGAVGGTAAFTALDAYYVSQKRPLPLGVACAQSIFGAVLVGVGGLLVAREEEAVGAPFVATGGALILAVPASAIAYGARQRPQQASLRLSPTGVVVAGRF